MNKNIIKVAIVTTLVAVCGLQTYACNYRHRGGSYRHYRHAPCHMRYWNNVGAGVVGGIIGGAIASALTPSPAVVTTPTIVQQPVVQTTQYVQQPVYQQTVYRPAAIIDDGVRPLTVSRTWNGGISVQPLTENELNPQPPKVWVPGHFVKSADPNSLSDTKYVAGHYEYVQ